MNMSNLINVYRDKILPLFDNWHTNDNFWILYFKIFVLVTEMEIVKKTV